MQGGARDVIVSGSSEPGEGEQKIFGRMRASKTDGHDEIVIGLDADLILQALLYHADTGANICIARPDSEKNPRVSETQLIDIPAVAAGIERAFGPDSCRDFVYLMTLVGNDFLPPLPWASIHADGIEVLMAARRDIGCDVRGPEGLVALFEHLALSEDARMISEDRRYFEASATCQSSAQRHTQNTGRQATVLELLPLLHPAKQAIVRPDVPGWRQRYHRRVLHVDEPGLRRACLEYLRGLEWSFRYASQEPVSWSWHYPFAAAPTAVDLLNALQSTPPEEYSSGSSPGTGPVADPGVLLLMVLPPQSRHLLPPDLQPLVTDVRLGAAHMFPSRFEIDVYLKHKTWECRPRLPDVDLHEIQTALRSRKT